VYRNSNNSLTASTWTTITWNTWYQSLDNNHAVYWDGATAMYVRATGWYLAHAWCYVNGNGGTFSIMGVRYVINGAYDAIRGGEYQARTAGGGFTGGLAFLHLTRQIYLTDGQYVQVQCYSNGAAPYLVASQNAFDMLYLGW
jgi:hypothetical protein